MYTNFEKTLAAISRCLPTEGEPTTKQLRRMYDLTLRLMSQELAVIYDLEAFGGSPAGQEGRTLAEQKSGGKTADGIVTLTISEPLPAMKRLTEAVEEHWKAMLHAAISQAAQMGPLPWFEKAFVAIKIVTPKGSNNAQVWDTSNRAIQVVLNNLKGIFFHDDNIEHMAFSVSGKWGGEGCTTVQILDVYRLQQFWDSKTMSF